MSWYEKAPPASSFNFFKFTDFHLSAPPSVKGVRYDYMYREFLSI